MSQNSEPKHFAAQLREILDPAKVEAPQNGVLRLMDHESGMTFDVKGVSDEAVAIRVDKIEHLKKALIPNVYRPLVCDYLLVEHSAKSKKQLAVLLELKTTVGPDSRPLEQLRRSLPILRYLQSACEVHFRQRIDLQERYVLAGNQYPNNFDKQSIRFDQGCPYDTQDYRGISVRVFVGSGNSFGTLVG